MSKTPVVDASYSHVSAKKSSAGRATRYISRRPENERDREEGLTRDSNWRDLDSEGATFGNEEAFKEEAKERQREKQRGAEERGKDLSKDKSPSAAAYHHITISPGTNDLTDEQMKELARPYTRDQQGNEREHYGAVHRDTDNHHAHLLVAGDRPGNRELAERKEQTTERVRTMERERELERDVEREGHRREPELERER